MSDFISVAECEDAVSRPGKFEGQPAYVPYFWESSLHGCGPEPIYPDAPDEDEEEDYNPFDDDECYMGPAVYPFVVDADDAYLFPELAIGQTVYLYESDSGFVSEVTLC